METDVEAATARTATLNVCEVALPLTVTFVAGMTAGFELVSDTVAPPDGAAPDKATVALMLLPPTTDAGDSATEETVTGAAAWMEIVPPLELIPENNPAGDTAITLVGVRMTWAAIADANTGTAAVATTPLGMVLAFTPTAMQVMTPEPEAQTRLLPAALSEGPAVRVTGPKTLVGYVRLHCNPAGKAPEGAVRLKLSGTTPPGAPPAAESPRDAV